MTRKIKDLDRAPQVALRVHVSIEFNLELAHGEAPDPQVEAIESAALALAGPGAVLLPGGSIRVRLASDSANIQTGSRRAGS